jgi:peptidyl-prolyl cis-trans isomerase A (cyclophilin A)
MKKNLRKLTILVFAGMITSTQCSNPEVKEESKKDPTQDSIISIDDIKPKVNLPERLSNDNIEAYLIKYGRENPETRVKIETEYGDIVLKLFEDTPLHRANFIQLIKKGIYKKTQFSRVVKGFVIQGGSSDETLAMDKKFYLGEYTLPHEMSLKHIHTHGALAMSRAYNGNPEKRSDAFDFYIVVGEKQTDVALYQLGKERDFRYTPEQIKRYKTQGGTPHLDMEHTVFGQVVSGMSAVMKINRLPVDASDWPEESVVIDLKVVE